MLGDDGGINSTAHELLLVNGRQLIVEGGGAHVCTGENGKFTRPCHEAP